MAEEAKDRQKRPQSAAEETEVVEVIPPSIEATQSQPQSQKKEAMLATGLEDYGNWVEYFKDHKPEEAPPFRRGRIWA